ncbi:hypothetical protein IMSHALPRED_004836 [Imshaugia aleurites]|uniref:Xylanolytic transcriptional activator regulatory domain-containing protein n=1 Tax=Imshaugia aleurites TaxID=172621 RepID=A0A8H3F7P2_9LECA|nr:hypothetical protein IMSHALPRED_004836 [Imshaugia aleurites]
MSCSYAAPGSRKKQSASSQSSNSPDDMQNRIDRLEGLVLSLMTNGSQSAGPAAAQRALSLNSSSGSIEYPQDVDVDIDGDYEDSGVVRGSGEDESETDQVVQSLGVMKVDNNKSMYYGEAHWAAILHDIKEVKNYFSEHKKQWEDQMLKVQEAKNRVDSAPQGPTFLFGGSNPPPYSDLLAQLPKRTVTDRLVSRYFNSYDPAVHILHPPSWQRGYERHWENPHKSGPAWLGQIFAIMCLAMHSYFRMDDEPPEFRGKSLALAANYRGLTGQCLLLADFTKPVNHMIETLVLHLHCEYARSRDAEVGTWVLVGMIVRLAMRMGYHRDPKYFPNITPFQGELRRRVWTFVRQSDLLFSFQIGLPSMIRLGDCDTELPRNLYDDEFDEDSKILPPSRPASEPTPVSYMCAKANMAFAFGKAVERLHSVSTSSYDEVMALDRDLREARADFPPHLRLRSIEDSMMDPGALVMQRLYLSILYHKGQCVLHRKFLTRARENNRYAHSRRTCVDSSMELLSHQATLHYESRPGHRLHGMKVFISSITAADFLLAAMIVALDLCQGAETEGGSQSSGDMYTWGLERRADMVRALEVSNDIWKETRDQSMEAFKASEILTVILNKIKYSRNPATGRAQQNPFPFPGPPNGADGQAFGLPGEEKPEHSAAMTLGMLSNGGMTPNSASMFNGAFPSAGGATPNMGDMQSSGLTPGYSMEQAANGIPSVPSPLSFFGNGNLAGDMPANLDWDAWDSYVQNASVDVGAQGWPASMDPALMTPAVDGQAQMPQTSSGSFNGSGGIFMGVSTPPGNIPI